MARIVVNAVVKGVGKLATEWNMPLYSMSGMLSTLRDQSNYATLVRVSTPADRFATALLMFCHHNDVRSLFVICSLHFLFDLKRLHLPKSCYHGRLHRGEGARTGHLSHLEKASVCRCHVSSEQAIIHTWNCPRT